MTYLLRAEFVRLFRAPFFLVLALLPLMPVIPLLIYREYFDNMQVIIIFAALFTGAVPAILLPHLIGTEYTDGTIRNKLISGHSRPCIFIVYFLIGIISTLLIFALSLAVIAFGSLFGGFTDSFESLAVYIATDVCALCVISAICAVISSSLHSKAISTALSLIINFFILFFCFAVFDLGTSYSELDHILYKIGGFLPWFQLTGMYALNYMGDKANEMIINSPDFDPTVLINRILTEQIMVDGIIAAVLFAVGLIVFAKRDIK